MKGETISLSKAQRKTAERILERVSEGCVDRPEDLVNEWKSVDEDFDYQKITTHVFENVDGEIPRKRDFISVSKIAGTTHSDPNIMQHRMENVLNLLISGEYQKQPEHPPKLEKIGDEYYVSVDGHHRVMAFKSLRLDEIYVKYIDTPLPGD